MQTQHVAGSGPARPNGRSPTVDLIQRLPGLPPIEVSDDEFLASVFRDLAPFAHVTGFADDPGRIPVDRRGLCWGGTHYNRANGQLSAEGWNRYFCISQFWVELADPRPRRRKAQFRQTHCIVADDVGEKVPIDRVATLPLPSWVLETSRGNYQWGWILEAPATDRARVDNLLDGLVNLGLAPDGKDPGMRGVTRYVRLPGGWNTKAKCGPGGFRCQMRYWAPWTTTTLEALASPFGVNLDASRSDGADRTVAEFADHPIFDSVRVLKDIRPGEYYIECPWVDEHTDRDNSGTWLKTFDTGMVGFECHHGHCQNRDTPDFLDKLGAKGKVDAWRLFRGLKDLESPLSGTAQGTGEWATEENTPDPKGAGRGVESASEDDYPAAGLWGGAPTGQGENNRTDATGANPAGLSTIPSFLDPPPAPPPAPPPGAPIGPVTTAGNGAVQGPGNLGPGGSGPGEADGGSIDSVRRLISSIRHGDVDAIARIIDAIAEAGFNPVQVETLLKDVRGHAGVTMQALQRQYKDRKRVVVERLKRETAARRAQELMSGGGGPAVPIYQAAPGDIAYPFPEGDLPDGRGLPHVENLRALCQHHGISIRHNVMTHAIEVNIPGARFFEEERENLQVGAMRDIAVASNLSTDRIDSLILALGCEAPYHPFIEWLKSGTWDGVRRFEALGSVVHGVDDPGLFLDVLRHWMRSIVVAALGTYEDSPPRGVLTFTGPQHVGKTAFFRKLLPKGMFLEGLHLDPRNKDDMIRATRGLLCELGELDATFRKSDIAVLKSFLSNTEDRVRLPYAPRESRFIRRTVYCATVNGREFLIDSTGNSRFWVFEVQGFDLDRLSAMRRDGTLFKIWLELLAEVQAGAPWLLPKDVERALEARGEAHRRVGAVEQGLEDMFDWDAPREQWQRVTTTAIAKMLDLRPSANGNYGITEPLRRLLHPHTGQKSAVRMRPIGGGALFKGWEVPPWRF